MLLALGSVSVSAAPDTTFAEWIRSGGGGFADSVVPPSGVEGIFGGSFYIIDPNAPVEFTFVTSHAGHDLVLSVASIDESGAVTGWQEVFVKTGNSVGTVNYNIDPRNYSYTATGTELLLRLYDKTTNYTYYSGAATGNPDGTDHAVSFYDYYDGKTLVGFEDLYNGGDKDFDDIVFLMSNVSNIPTPVPEPETYAMMLAGLGVMAAVARRRRSHA
jgi:hypothetical protein